LKGSLVAERGDWYHGRDEEAFRRPILDTRRVTSGTGPC
jgi:hypothetical protein